MGISSIQSYCGAQIFEALGIHQSVIDKYFTWTPSRIGGIDLEIIALEAEMRHRQAYPTRPMPAQYLQSGGDYQWRQDGEYHLFNPQTIHKLQKAVRNNSYATFKEYSELLNAENRPKGNIARLVRVQNTGALSSARRSGTGGIHRAALQDWRHELWLDQQGSP